LFYYVLKYVLLGPLLRLFFRPRIEGLEHVPATGAAIVAGNHLSFSDHFLMPAMLKRRITFLAKKEYFTGPGIKAASPPPSSAAPGRSRSTAPARRRARRRSARASAC
jgi:1-acyl-sn-glycerol-3-phosphate acyltransferase